MSEWLKSFVAFMLMVSVAMQMLPNQKYEQYVRLFTGFLLVILVLQPVLKIGSADVYLEKKILEFVQEQEKIEKEIRKEGTEFQMESEQLHKNVTDFVEIQKIPRVEVATDD